MTCMRATNWPYKEALRKYTAEVLGLHKHEYLSKGIDDDTENNVQNDDDDQ